MTEVVIALLMIVSGEIKEHRIQDSMSQCLKGKRVAERVEKENIEYQCVKSKAETEQNIDGSKSIKALILD
jgi:membrane-bound inhibitor of C-type lysozyme|tara:strand:- start:610 stop:822 length:213 start_codon:yes stop_codon:yes gene_type:complete